MSQVDPTSATHQRRPFTHGPIGGRARSTNFARLPLRAQLTAQKTLTISLDALRRHEPRFIFASASVKSERTSLRCVEESLL